jgi:hypothetical protein
LLKSMNLLLHLIFFLLMSTQLSHALTLSEKLNILVSSYPQSIQGIKNGALILNSGKQSIIIDDGISRTDAESEANADVEDSLRQIYAAGPCKFTPKRGYDAGRFRSEPLLRAMYGNSSEAVQANLVPVKWFGQTLMVTKINGVNKALDDVFVDLSSHPKLRNFLTKSSVFNWRTVAGQTNMSVHSFGAAIDINTKNSNYWLWAGGKKDGEIQYVNRIPIEIVNIFERHGFIWGGRWYHYDTMHFEYRPELIEIGKRSGETACK